jgi:hypothetical protein
MVAMGQDDEIAWRRKMMTKMTKMMRMRMARLKMAMKKIKMTGGQLVDQMVAGRWRLG